MCIRSVYIGYFTYLLIVNEKIDNHNHTDDLNHRLHI